MRYKFTLCITLHYIMWVQLVTSVDVVYKRNTVSTLVYLHSRVDILFSCSASHYLGRK